jgi:hypothetical protein
MSKKEFDRLEAPGLPSKGRPPRHRSSGVIATAASIVFRDITKLCCQTGDHRAVVRVGF